MRTCQLLERGDRRFVDVGGGLEPAVMGSYSAAKPMM